MHLNILFQLYLINQQIYKFSLFLFIDTQVFYQLTYDNSLKDNQSYQQMNVKAFQAQQFAYKHYLKLLQCRPAIDTQSPTKQRVPYSSRNLTHMTRYQEQIKTNKLIHKLVEIQTANVKPNYFKKSKNSKRKLSKKNRNLTFSDNKTYLSMNKSLVNPFKFKEKQIDILQTNCDIVEKLSVTQSSYKKAFSKDREKKLQNYSKLLVKSKQDQQVRDNFFQLYDNLKLMKTDLLQTPKRPGTGKGRALKASNMLTQITRPHTAK